MVASSPFMDNLLSCYPEEAGRCEPKSTTQRQAKVQGCSGLLSPKTGKAGEADEIQTGG